MKRSHYLYHGQILLFPFTPRGSFIKDMRAAPQESLWDMYLQQVTQVVAVPVKRAAQNYWLNLCDPFWKDSRR
eukprot:1159401-Pelagomonas_calceolata.AAC.7